jgi:hypothetical protein
MLVALITVFIVPVYYCWLEEKKLKKLKRNELE